MRWITLLGVSASLFLASGSAQATLVLYTDQASFNTAIDNTAPVASENFSSQTPGALTKGVAHNFGFFSVTAVDETVGGPNNIGFYLAPNPLGYQTPIAPFATSQHIGWSEWDPWGGFGVHSGQFGPRITINLADTLGALSLWWLDSDRTDEYTLSIDGVSVPNFPSLSSTYSGATFIGVVSSVPFSQFVLSTPTTSPGGFVEPFGIDDVTFYTAASLGIPEPGTFALLFAGLAGLAVRFSRRRRR